MSATQSFMPKAKEARVYRYDPDLLAHFCAENEFYQNQDGIIIPITPLLITNYFHARRRMGPDEVKAKFIGLTNSLITDVRKFIPIIVEGKEEWVEKYDAS